MNFLKNVEVFVSFYTLNGFGELYFRASRCTLRSRLVND